MISSESYIFLAVLAALALVALVYLLSPMSLHDEPLLYLIGVNHARQFKYPATRMFGEAEAVREKREAFKAHIVEKIDQLDIEILAEEWSDEVPGNDTVPWQIGKARGIEHRFCDPTAIEKQARGIEVDPRKETDSDRDKRRRFWLSKIADCKQRRVLFVCGDKHFDAFAQLLESNGFNVQRGAHYDISDEEFYGPRD